MMKISKLLKIGTLALLAGSLCFFGCSDEAGEGDTDGSKTNTTMTIDGTSSGKAFADGATFRRFWSQLGSSEKVAEVTTTVTIDLNKCVGEYVPGKAYVAGFVFDLNKNSSDSDKYDACVFGFNPGTKKAYVEHYSAIEKLSNLDSSNGALGTSDNNIFGNGDWGSLIAGTHYKEDSTAKTITFVIQLKQATKGTYDVYMYAPDKSANTTTKLGSYIGSTKEEIKVNGTKTTEYATGAIGVYGAVSKDFKIVANYVTDKTSVTGSFHDEVVEE